MNLQGIKDERTRMEMKGSPDLIDLGRGSERAGSVGAQVGESIAQDLQQKPYLPHVWIQ